MALVNGYGRSTSMNSPGVMSVYGFLNSRSGRPISRAADVGQAAPFLMPKLGLTEEQRNEIVVFLSKQRAGGL